MKDERDATSKRPEAAGPYPVVGGRCHAERMHRPDVSPQVANALRMRSLSVTFRGLLLAAAVMVLAAILHSIPAVTAAFLAGWMILLAVLAQTFYLRFRNEARAAGQVMYLPGVLRGHLVRIDANGQTIRIR